LQIDGTVEEVAGIEPLDKKFESFGFEVIKIDGHNFDEIETSLNKAKAIKGKPTAILAKTVKGKGVSFMENQVGWHGKACNAEELAVATKELEDEIKRLEAEL
jgi:transketolase